MSLILSTYNYISHRDLVANGEDLIGSLLSMLTNELVDISANEIPFNGGTFGGIDGPLDKFGLNFDGLVSEFLDRYSTFNADLDLRPISLPSFDLRPRFLPQFPSLLQIGSKIPSIQYYSKLNNLLWDKLAGTFLSHTFNGVKIPNIPNGQTFAATFPRGKFPGMIFAHFVSTYFMRTI